MLEEIVTEIRSEFEKLLDLVMGKEAQTMTAGGMERAIFKSMVKIGKEAMYLFLVNRTEKANRDKVINSKGKEKEAEKIF